jgi:hypothetical protein
MMEKRTFERWKLGSVLALAGTLAGAVAADLDFRTDINPALLYFQAYQNMPQLSEDDSQHLCSRTGRAGPGRTRSMSGRVSC